jgi:predicted Zn finger-like uncharacterized protein
VIIQCPSCQARYQYDEQRFRGKASKRIRCALCKEVFVLANPAIDDPPAVLGHVTNAPGSAAAVPVTEDAPLGLPAGKRLSLAILGGPDAGRLYRIEAPRITIGREGADLVLEDPEAAGLHAAIEVREAVTTLHDLGSNSGTLSNSQKIEGAVELSDRSEFQVGATTLMLIVTHEPMSAPQMDIV